MERVVFSLRTQLHAGCKQSTVTRVVPSFRKIIENHLQMLVFLWFFYDFLDLLVSLQQGLINVTLLTTHKNESERLVGAQAMAAWIRSWQGARKWSESPEFQTQPEEVIFVLSYL